MLHFSGIDPQIEIAPPDQSGRVTENVGIGHEEMTMVQRAVAGLAPKTASLGQPSCYKGIFRGATCGTSEFSRVRHSSDFFRERAQELSLVATTGEGIFPGWGQYFTCSPSGNPNNGIGST